MDLHRYERYPLTFGPTPIQPLKRLSAHLAYEEIAHLPRTPKAALRDDPDAFSAWAEGWPEPLCTCRSNATATIINLRMRVTRRLRRPYPKKTSATW